MSKKFGLNLSHQPLLTEEMSGGQGEKSQSNHNLDPLSYAFILEAELVAAVNIN